MRKRFETQINIGQIPISELMINPKNKNALEQLIAALKEIYCNAEYNEKIFSLLEQNLSTRNKMGRPGMNLWVIFVLAQVRMVLNCSYEFLHHLANNDRLLRVLLGIERNHDFERIEYEYQNIYDNICGLDEQMLKKINEVIVAFGHSKVFKKKEGTALRLKADSFVVKSNVHFPTDYNLLWDCARKSLDVVSVFVEKYDLPDWRKLKFWYRTLKGLMRELGKANALGGKNKEERIKKVAEAYLQKAQLLVEKLQTTVPTFPICSVQDVAKMYELENYMRLLEKHINLVDRRLLKKETIPHEEKMFSIFETYTEWVVKGKKNPAVELGKKVTIVTDQYNLLLLHHVMDQQQDRDIVLELADNLLDKYKHIGSISFDKGYWNANNKQILELAIDNVIMCKLGKRTKKEEALESSKLFRRLKNKHSAVESNINELEHRGLDFCPDRGYPHFKTYIALAVCSYNLRRIGKKLLENRLHKIALRKAA
ncbi:MAG: ISNCY family transposase [Prevotellaceae bacterium]|jgi:hypothetical protein|nr:ISNCY family transposase [Prevotellaceae bacterium]